MQASHGQFVLINRRRAIAPTVERFEDDEGKIRYRETWDDGGTFRVYMKRGIRDEDGNITLAYFGDNAPSEDETYGGHELLPGDQTTVENLKLSILNGPGPNPKKSLEVFLAERSIPFNSYVNSDWTPWIITGNVATYRPEKQKNWATYVGEPETIDIVGPIMFGIITAGASIANALGIAAETTTAATTANTIATKGFNVAFSSARSGEVSILGVAGALSPLLTPGLDAPIIDVSEIADAPIASVVEAADTAVVSEFVNVTGDAPVFEDFFSETIFDADTGYTAFDQFQGYADDMIDTAISDPTIYPDSVDVFPEQIEEITIEGIEPAYAEEPIADDAIQTKPHSPTDPYDVMEGSEDLIGDTPGEAYKVDGIASVDTDADDLPFSKSAAVDAVKTVGAQAVKALATPGSTQASAKRTVTPTATTSKTGRTGAQAPPLADIFGKIKDYGKMASDTAKNVRAVTNEAQSFAKKIEDATIRADKRIAMKAGTVAAGNRTNQNPNAALIAAAIGAFVLFG